MSLLAGNAVALFLVLLLELDDSGGLEIFEQVAQEATSLVEIYTAILLVRMKIKTSLFVQYGTMATNILATALL
jgi:hypothetical protein